MPKMMCIYLAPSLSDSLGEAVPLLFKASRVSVSPDALPNALAACCALCRGKSVATEAWFVGLQQRALEGEVDFVKAAAELLEDSGLVIQFFFSYVIIGSTWKMKNVGGGGRLEG